MTTVHLIPSLPGSEKKPLPFKANERGKYVVLTKGAMENILPLCTHIYIDGDERYLDGDLKEGVISACNSFMDMGLRVISFAYKSFAHANTLHSVSGLVSTDIETDMVFAGLIGLEDPPRAEVPEAVRKCSEAGIRIIMITGDGSRTAVAIAREIGLVEGTPTVIEGHDFNQMGDAELRTRLAGKEVIFASNIPEAVPYLAYIMFRIPLPLTVVQILAVDLGTDMLPALALGAEKPTPDVMHQPPRKLHERLLNPPLIFRAYFFLGPIEAIACMSGFFYVLFQGGWIWGTVPPADNMLYLQATSACLTAIIITQIGNVFACRSSRESLLHIGFLSNRLIFAGIAVTLLLQLFIVYHPFGNEIFGTAPLRYDVWMFLVPFSFLLLAAEELRKVYIRKRHLA
ncbi:MAG: cation transporting ATPase C-terminal domain-containing protein [Nitrospirota bacterium]